MTLAFALQAGSTDLDTRCTLAISLGAVVVLVVSGSVIAGLNAAGCLRVGMRKELWLRWRSWVVLAVAMLLPALLGGFWIIVALFLLGVLCYGEFARATGVGRERLLTVLVWVGMAAVLLAGWGRSSELLLATAVLTVLSLIAAPILADRPEGYPRRVGLAVLGFLLFGVSLSFLGCLAGSSGGRPLLLLVLLAVSLNDVFAFCVGKLLGGPRLIPRTSPGKTVAGSVGALVLTTLLVAAVAHALAPGTALDRPGRLIGLGVLLSVLGQLGDLVISAIKRDLGIKDMGRILPGHGGWLDRFDSLILVPAPVFYYLSYHLPPLGADLAVRAGLGG
jgi:phosphatidate cytidylyltransferase